MGISEIRHELMNARKYIENFRTISGTQAKMIILHLINSLDKMTSLILKTNTSLERDYLTLSSQRLFTDMNLEKEFYETYFYMKNLLDKTMLRVSSDKIRITGFKQSLMVDKDFFNDLYSRVETVTKQVM